MPNVMYLGIFASYVSILRDIAIILVAIKGFQALNTYINRNGGFRS